MKYEERFAEEICLLFEIFGHGLLHETLLVLHSKASAIRHPRNNVLALRGEQIPQPLRERAEVLGSCDNTDFRGRMQGRNDACAMDITTCINTTKNQMATSQTLTDEHGIDRLRGSFEGGALRLRRKVEKGLALVGGGEHRWRCHGAYFYARTLSRWRSRRPCQ